MHTSYTLSLFCTYIVHCERFCRHCSCILVMHKHFVSDSVHILHIGSDSVYIIKTLTQINLLKYMEYTYFDIFMEIKQGQAMNNLARLSLILLFIWGHSEVRKRRLTCLSMEKFHKTGVHLDHVSIPF